MVSAKNSSQIASMKNNGIVELNPYPGKNYKSRA